MARNARYDEIINVVTKPIITKINGRTISIFTAAKNNKEIISVVSSGAVIKDVIEKIHAGMIVEALGMYDEECPHTVFCNDFAEKGMW